MDAWPNPGINNYEQELLCFGTIGTDRAVDHALQLMHRSVPSVFVASKQSH